MQLFFAPDALILAIGCAGAGKSTALARWFPHYEILSSDHLRLMLRNDAANQDCSPAVFALLAQIADHRLAHGLLTVIDATNLNPIYRAPWFALAARRRRPCYGLVFTTDLATCRMRNSTRSRQVPADVLTEQFAQWTADRPALHREPFTRLYFLSHTTEAYPSPRRKALPQTDSLPQKATTQPRNRLFKANEIDEEPGKND
ncbi:ATP-binding protein [Acanthopleuribacter pedis]|uniref:AAA family ATPase n=1 Tax=Acanthopleuribacter pedis TaxID=442870 RepID=A0A8J7QDC4_9BACT|nr:ATP-binding protein [Acanthopleuribacter pedis]MBO1318986.1 AAA family ATPase [Acanthopleuribacter pedis]